MPDADAHRLTGVQSVRRAPLRRDVARHVRDVFAALPAGQDARITLRKEQDRPAVLEVQTYAPSTG